MSTSHAMSYDEKFNRAKTEMNLTFDEFTTTLSIAEQKDLLQEWRTKFTNNIVIEVWKITRSKYYDFINKLGLEVNSVNRKPTNDFMRLKLLKEVPSISEFEKLSNEDKKNTIETLKQTVGAKLVMQKWNMRDYDFWQLVKSLNEQPQQKELTTEIISVGSLPCNPNSNISEIKDRVLYLHSHGGERSKIIIQIAEEIVKHSTWVRKIFQKLASEDRSFGILLGYDEKGIALTKGKAKEQLLNFPKEIIPIPEEKTEIKNEDIDNEDVIEEVLEEDELVFSNDQKTKDMQEILKVFADRWYKPSTDDIEGLEEQYLIIRSRGQDPVTWLTTMIKEIAKKSPQKRQINYLIGMIRNRLNKGWGTLRSEDEELIIHEIEELLNTQLSMNQRTAIYRIMGSYGSVRLSINVHKVNLVDLYLEQLEKQCSKTNIKPINI